ncbi:MAG: hypothetical protein KAI84_21325, partial [Gammaproteobacteria bacterium]|nr:hypothetical protein [Gammaproteobacteria bacterium]
QRTNTTSIPHSGTARYPFIHTAPQKRLPAPHTTEAGSADRDGAPGQTREERGGRSEERLIFIIDSSIPFWCNHWSITLLLKKEAK